MYVKSNKHHLCASNFQGIMPGCIRPRSIQGSDRGDLNWVPIEMVNEWADLGKQHFRKASTFSLSGKNTWFRPEAFKPYSVKRTDAYNWGLAFADWIFGRLAMCFNSGRRPQPRLPKNTLNKLHVSTGYTQKPPKKEKPISKLFLKFSGDWFVSDKVTFGRPGGGWQGPLFIPGCVIRKSLR